MEAGILQILHTLKRAVALQGSSKGDGGEEPQYHRKVGARLAQG